MRYKNKPRWHISFITTYLCLVISTAVGAAVITGKVVKVADGDTITILTPQKKQVKIRLYGIDTPERKQPYSKKAGQLTASIVAGQNVQVEIYDTDRYGRTVGVVYVDGINVNEEILRSGYAWQYRKYCKAPFCSGWLQLEEDAKAAKIGLWADPKAVPPWEWRHMNRK